MRGRGAGPVYHTAGHQGSYTPPSAGNNPNPDMWLDDGKQSPIRFRGCVFLNEMNPPRGSDRPIPTEEFHA
jgi:hypothetical protein